MYETINIEIDGETNTLKNWATKFQVPYISAYRRYKRGKQGRDIFAVKAQSSTPRERGTPQTFTEMGQLNISMPKWQIDELERIARLNGMKRTKYAHKLIADFIQNKM